MIEVYQNISQEISRLFSSILGAYWCEVPINILIRHYLRVCASRKSSEAIVLVKL